MTNTELDKAILPPTLENLPQLPSPIPADTKYLVHREGQCVKILNTALNKVLELYKANQGSIVVAAGATFTRVSFLRQIPRAVVFAGIKSTSNQLIMGVVTHVNLDGFRFDFQAPIPATGSTELSWKVFSL